MSQYMSQHLSLGLRQEQRLTPQLIQSMNILQLPLMALEAKIREEMERNPALESDDFGPGDGGSSPAPSPADRVNDHLTPEERDESQREADGFSRLESLSREYDIDEGDLSYGRPHSGNGERDSKMDAMANTASCPQSLHEHLHDQWVFLEVDDITRKAGELILNYIEDDG